MEVSKMKLLKELEKRVAEKELSILREVYDYIKGLPKAKEYEAEVGDVNLEDCKDLARAIRIYERHSVTGFDCGFFDIVVNSENWKEELRRAGSGWNDEMENLYITDPSYLGKNDGMRMMFLLPKSELTVQSLTVMGMIEDKVVEIMKEIDPRTDAYVYTRLD
jgi:hypothetical protein